jgi:hypothetical protein
VKVGDRVTLTRDHEWQIFRIGTVVEESSCGWFYGNSKDTEVGFWIHWDWDERLRQEPTHGWVPKNVSERVIQALNECPQQKEEGSER